MSASYSLLCSAVLGSEVAVVSLPTRGSGSVDLGTARRRSLVLKAALWNLAVPVYIRIVLPGPVAMTAMHFVRSHPLTLVA